MNILTAHWNTARLRRQLRGDYTSETARAYLDAAYASRKYGATLRMLSTCVLWLLAAAVGIDNVVNQFGDSGRDVTVFSLAFPVLAGALAWSLPRRGNSTNHNAGDALEVVNNAHDAHDAHDILTRSAR